MSHKLMELPTRKASPRRPERSLAPGRSRARALPGQSDRPTVQLAAHARSYLRFRRFFELFLALTGLVVLLPLFAAAAMLVKLTSRGPAVYSQARVGRHGRIFTMYKFRTMIHNCESLTGPRWAIPGDPRITPIGQFLRLTHLDELPQLWNVIRGDMSLIGPRPERPEFVQQLKRALPQYEGRQATLPGITGLAQVQLPPDSDLESVRRKLACDLFYIRSLGPWLDVRILLGTIAKAAGLPFHVVRALFHLPSWHGAAESIVAGPEKVGILENQAA
jgi:lipopolysaccharide/colanic/teichoic acid biosynthesis glycosyltransferase